MKLSEAIYNGLTNLGDSYQRSRLAKQAHELESIKLGLIDDSVKLKMLKRKLYNDAMDGKDTEELRKNIELIIKEVEGEDKSEAAIYNGLFSFFGNAFYIAVLAFGTFWLSGEITEKCPRINSTFCNQMRQFDGYFNGENSPLLLDKKEQK
ncbi:MAG: hypothetical protein AAFS12_00285 [Cyanobacteria bacterium J06632_19]